MATDAIVPVTTRAEHRWGAHADDWAQLEFLAGYGPYLLPVVSRPGATISPDSKLKALGKVPSRYNLSRQVVGFHQWVKHRANSAQIESWSKDPDYGICLITGASGVVAFDVDVTDPDIAGAVWLKIRAWADMVGVPVADIARRSRADSSKFLIPLRVEGIGDEFIDAPTIAKRVMRLAAGAGAIELLAHGQQFVAFGTHPGGHRYAWRHGTTIGMPDAFPVVTLDSMEQLWAMLVDDFADKDAVSGGGSVAVRKAGPDLDVEDPVGDYLLDQGLVLSQDRGMLHIACPWSAGHSGGVDGDTSTSWFLAGTHGYAQGHFRCLHASCSHRTDADFKEIIGYSLSQFDEVDEDDEDAEELRRLAGANPDSQIITVGDAVKSATKWLALLSEAQDETGVRRVLAKVGAATNDRLIRSQVVYAAKLRMKEITGLVVPAAALKEIMDMASGGPRTPVHADDTVQAPGWLADWVWCNGNDKFINLETKVQLSVTGFNHSFTRHMPENDAGQKIFAVIGATQLWPIPVVDRIGYIPSADAVYQQDGVSYLNTFRDTGALPATGAEYDSGVVDIFLEHLKNLIPEEVARKVLLDWLAHNVQYPGRKIRWAPMIKGCPGDGKSILIRLMAGCLGEQNVSSMTATDVSGGFTDWAFGHCVVALEEVRLHGNGRYDILDKWKTYVTNDVVSIHIKKQSIFNAPNVTNYLAFTNYEDAIPIDNADRRYCIIRTRCQTDTELLAWGMNDAYFNRLANALNSGIASIKAFLLAHKMSEFFNPNGRAPITKARALMIEATKSEEQTRVESLIDRGGAGYSDAIVCSSILIAAYKTEYGSDLYPSHCTRILTEMGYRPHGRVRWMGSQQRIWIRGADFSEAADFAERSKLLLESTLKPEDMEA